MGERDDEGLHPKPASERHISRRAHRCFPWCNVRGSSNGFERESTARQLRSSERRPRFIGRRDTVSSRVSANDPALIKQLAQVLHQKRAVQFGDVLEM
jgi:hypothetical protein